jgi:hypothetical protein
MTSSLQPKSTPLAQLRKTMVDSSVAFWNHFALECNQLADILKSEHGGLIEPSFIGGG